MASYPIDHVLCLFVHSGSKGISKWMTVTNRQTRKQSDREKGRELKQLAIRQTNLYLCRWTTVEKNTGTNKGKGRQTKSSVRQTHWKTNRQTKVEKVRTADRWENRPSDLSQITDKQSEDPYRQTDRLTLCSEIDTLAAVQIVIHTSKWNKQI